MPDRRQFLRVVGAGLASMAACRNGLAAMADPTWLTYAVNAEVFQKNLPFLDRLRKLAEAGFTRYEFGRWKAKDIDAIARLNEELGIQAVLFIGYQGFGNPGKWKDGLLESVEDSAELAPRMGATRLAIVPPEFREADDRDEQAEDLVEALKEAVEKVAEADVTLILESVPAVAGRSRALLTTPDEAAAVARAVNSPRLRFAFEVRKAADGDPVERIGKLKDLAGYYRVSDLGRPDLPKILKAIQRVGYADPIGMALPDRGDPMPAIDELRKADAAAKAF